MSKLEYTPLDEIPRIHESLNASFKAGKMQSIAFRKKQLARIAYMIKENLSEINESLRLDLHRAPVETAIGDTAGILHEAVHAYENVEEWIKNSKPPTTIAFQSMNVNVKPTPKGVVLIIAPFNYPYGLAFNPLIAAIAAGCTVVLKLAESIPNVSRLSEALVRKYLDPEVVRVVQGGVEETSALLRLEWNHIFFTGSPKVGRIVATAAAKFLTPVTLELGGKCPIIVDPRHANFEVIARRILWGRTMNSGQVCVSPDYVLIPRQYQKPLVDALHKAYKEFYPEGNYHSESFARLVSTASAKRVEGYLSGTRGNISIGGQTDGVYFSPTIVTDVKGDDSTMQEEMFGPVLSIIPLDQIDEAIDFVNDRPQPLALYVFSKDSKFKDQVTRNTRSGAIIFNDTMTHVGAAGLPFGGSGMSGYGQYHGKWGFDTFTHFRASLDVPIWGEKLLNFRYPPYNNTKYKMAMASIAPLVFPFDKDGRRTLLSRLKTIAPLMALFLILGYYRNRIKFEYNFTRT
ncbi:aldehyde dehydrogenase [Serendipita vermifera]|nr:aldehyde dehydrogenase [Serendipita vermifera]